MWVREPFGKRTIILHIGPAMKNSERKSVSGWLNCLAKKRRRESGSKSARISLINYFPSLVHEVSGFSGCGQNAIRTRLRRGDAKKDAP